MNVPKEKPFSAILDQTTLTVMTNTPLPVLIACVRTQAVMFINCRWSLSSAQVTKAPSRLKVNLLMHPPPRYLSDAVDHELKKNKTVVI